MKKLIPIILLLILASCTAAPPPLHSEGPDLMIPLTAELPSTATVDRGLVEEIVLLPALTRINSTPLAFEQGDLSVFEAFHALPGDRVYAGQTLATLYAGEQRETLDEIGAEISRLSLAFAITEESYNIRIEHTRQRYLSTLTRAAEELDDSLLETAQALYNDIEMYMLRRDLFMYLQSTAISEAQADRDQVRKHLDRVALVAPFDGVVTFVANLSYGMQFDLDAHVMYVAPDGQSVFVEYVGGALPALNNAVRLYGDFSGRLLELEHIPMTEYEQEHNERQGLPYRIRFEIPSGFEAAVGEFVWIRLYTAFLEDVLRIPRSALFFQGSTPYVYIVEDGTTMAAHPEFGVITNTYVEVLSGLREGDHVLVN